MYESCGENIMYFSVSNWWKEMKVEKDQIICQEYY